MSPATCRVEDEKAGVGFGVPGLTDASRIQEPWPSFAHIDDARGLPEHGAAHPCVCPRVVCVAEDEEGNLRIFSPDPFELLIGLERLHNVLERVVQRAVGNDDSWYIRDPG